MRLVPELSNSLPGKPGFHSCVIMNAGEPENHLDADLRRHDDVLPSKSLNLGCSHRTGNGIS